MKRLAFIFAVATAITLSSCGNKKENKTSSETETPAMEQTMEAEAVEETVAETTTEADSLAMEADTLATEQ